MKISEILTRTTQFFAQKGMHTPRLDAELLIAASMSWDRVKVYMNLDYPMNETELEHCRGLVRRRLAGEPIAYILNEKHFYKSRFYVDAGVLIPRPETECLVEFVLTRVPIEQHGTLIDFGCGSGCIGLSILHDRPNLKLIAVDISDKAIVITQKNAESLGLSERVTTVNQSVNEFEFLPSAHLDAPLVGIVANPPYVARDDKNIETNVVKFEPDTALFAGDDGLELIKSWLSKAEEVLPPAAFVAMEIGATQYTQVSEFINEKLKFKDLEKIKDLAGFDRHIFAIKS